MPSEQDGRCRNMEDALSRRKGGGQQWAFSRCFATNWNWVTFNPDFERKYNLHWLCVFSSLISVSPQSVSASLRAGRGLRKTTFPQSVKADIWGDHKGKEVMAFCALLLEVKKWSAAGQPACTKLQTSYSICCLLLSIVPQVGRWWGMEHGMWRWV